MRLVTDEPTVDVVTVLDDFPKALVRNDALRRIETFAATLLHNQKTASPAHSSSSCSNGSPVVTILTTFA